MTACAHEHLRAQRGRQLSEVLPPGTLNEGVSREPKGIQGPGKEKTQRGKSVLNWGQAQNGL